MVRTVRLLLLALLLVAAGAPAARADGPANAGLSASDNPLEGMRWAGYRPKTVDPTNDPLGAYWGGVRSGAVGRVIEQPRFRWFGAWIPTWGRGLKWPARKVSANYVQDVTRGDPDVGVQMAIFRLDPFEKQIRDRPQDEGAHRTWMREFLGGIPDGTRMAVVLQPDLPIALDARDGGRQALGLIRWTVDQLQAPRFRHVTVYLDAGASDWLPVDRAVRLLRSAGVAKVRGFALNLTHYASTRNETAYGRKVVAGLARAGIPGRHFVISTAMNGRPFPAWSPAFRSPEPCSRAPRSACVAIGHPFSTDTGDPAVDAYLWAGRWWYDNARVRSRDDLVALIENSPFRAIF